MIKPTWDHEKQYWEQGINLIAGVDEAGMGALAGPVCAGAVVFDNQKTPPRPWRGPPSRSRFAGGDSPRWAASLPLSGEALNPANGKAGYIPYRKILVEPARGNRKKPTLAEKAMWQGVLQNDRLESYKWLRQKPLNNFIADFYCPALLLVVEIDGDSHQGNEEYDELRSDKLAEYGIKVLRYSNQQVVNKTHEVLQLLVKQISQRRDKINTPLDKGGLGGIIRDSKTLSAKQREESVDFIKKKAAAWAVGEASVKEITALNIRGASHLAMRRAVESLSLRPQMLFVDGNPAQPHTEIAAVNIIGGDKLSISIAAASILAKVHRDEIMKKLDKKYPQYGLAAHKGYGTLAHMTALKTHGATIIHRPTYAPVARVLVRKEAMIA